MGQSLSLILYQILTGRSETRVIARAERLLSNGNISVSEKNQRLAYDLPTRTRGEVLWLHAASQTFVPPALELFSRISEDRPDLSAVITVPGPCSEQVFQRVPECVITACPEENTAVLHRFFAHWDPDCLIWIGGAFRPLLLNMAQERRIPSISADTTRLSASVQTHSAIPGLRTRTLRCFDCAFTADQNATLPWKAAKFEADRIEALGFLEEGGMVPVCDENLLGELSEGIGTRPVWYAAQVSPRELDTILAAHRRALRRAHRLLLILSVTQETVAAATEQCHAVGLIAEVIQQSGIVSEATQVLITTFDGQEGLWYRLASVSFLGGSFCDQGGIDPYPAASMGSAIIHGPDVGRFANAYRRFNKANAARRVRDGKELTEAVQQLLSPDQAAILAQAAWAVTTTGAEVTDRVADLAQDFLDLRDRIGP